MGKIRSDKGYNHASNLHCPKLEENIYPLHYQREKWYNKNCHVLTTNKTKL